MGDRGKQSLETITLMFAYKVKYPENFFQLRGNHECASITRIYGFYDECKRRYNIKMWKSFCDTFNCMPVCGLIDKKIMCMHGGLSPEINKPVLGHTKLDWALARAAKNIHDTNRSMM